MDSSAIITTLQAAVAGVTLENGASIDMPTIYVPADRLVEVCKALRDLPSLKYQVLVEITAADYFPREPRFEVVYHLFSMKHKHSLVLKVMLPRWKDDQPGELPEVPSVSGLWSTADWHEREVYDLSGIYFTGHPNMRRILCPEDWVGHALRKDYEMPLEYHGIRGR